MRAGRLIYLLEFIGIVKEQSPSGFESETEKVLFKCRGAIKKQFAVFDKDGLMAKEQFFGERITFQVRTNKLLSQATRLRYAGETYEITMLQPSIDRTTFVTCKKKDA